MVLFFTAKCHAKKVILLLCDDTFLKDWNTVGKRVGRIEPIETDFLEIDLFF
jgi:hypothetical protein